MGLNPILFKQIISGKVDDVKASKNASLPFQGQYKQELERKIYTITRKYGLNVFPEDTAHVMGQQWHELNLNDFLQHSGLEHRFQAAELQQAQGLAGETTPRSVTSQRVRLRRRPDLVPDAGDGRPLLRRRLLRHSLRAVSAHAHRLLPKLEALE